VILTLGMECQWCKGLNGRSRSSFSSTVHSNDAFRPINRGPIGQREGRFTTMTRRRKKKRSPRASCRRGENIRRSTRTAHGDAVIFSDDPRRRPSPLAGEGKLAKGEQGEGRVSRWKTLQAALPPHPASLRCATLSRKGRGWHARHTECACYVCSPSGPRLPSLLANIGADEPRRVSLLAEGDVR
jgi:hypothetical protein